MDAYSLWKTAHIISAAILFGTGLGIAFFAWFGYRRAIRTGELDGLRTVLHLTVLADLFFTTPAVVFQLLSGAVLMNMDSWSPYSPWALTVLGLFILVGLLWLPVVVVQIAMSREAEKAGSFQALSPKFHQRFIAWFVLGIPAFLLVLVIFFLMVAKPLSVMAAG
jgi:uncharacterized membrane protein